MKRKLRIEELSVASFSTEPEDVPEQRGTVRGMQVPGTWQSCLTCYLNQYTCAQTCPRTCNVTCQTCITCVNAPCP
jgi:hypothetical protein